ncbi:MAG: hypothetical protein FJX62_13325 [Alphaproteobacteria bacterium]|nr:hypothetical protein [Alphaproteobacteria bacterium]
MGILMIRCPRTGRGIPTGYEMNGDEFARAPVFFARTRCALCGGDHEWFAPQAWVCEDSQDDAAPRSHVRRGTARAMPEAV